VWIQIFRALPSYRGDSQFGTWAHRIAVNRTLNALRKTRRLANIETEVEEDSASVEMDTDRSFIAASIEEAMAKLSPGGRAVFVLHDVEGFTHEEIARDLGITAGGSKSQLFKARAKLRKLLAHLVDKSDGQKSRTERGHVAPARCAPSGAVRGAADFGGARTSRVVRSMRDGTSSPPRASRAGE